MIEIGGVHSIDTAKEIIGKTIELEFKVPATKEQQATLAAERKLLANDLFNKIKAHPTQVTQLTQGKESQEIYTSTIVAQDLDTLSPLFSAEKERFLTAKAGDVIQVEGMLDGVSEQAQGYGLFVIDSVEQQTNPIVTLEKFTAIANQFNKEVGIATGVTHNSATGAIAYDTTSKEIRINTDIQASSFGGGDGLQVLAMYNVTDEEHDTILNALQQQVLVNGTTVLINKNPQWIVAVNPETNEILNGAFFSYAAPSVNNFGKPIITINFNDKGREIFCNLTKAFINQQMAIFVGGELQTAPVINEAICAGSAQIDGDFTTESAKLLSDSLNEGALPAPLILSSEEKVSPVLGEGAINGAFLAGGIGLVLMFIFLLAFYGLRTSLIGIAVMIAFLVYSLAIFKIIDYSFSLSGIAAIILSLAMGIDANIIIYERLKEELDAGKTWSNAVDAAYERSWLAIRDGNLTNIIVYVVLFGMGMSIFKGFGFAGLITGLLILIINVPLTRVLLKLFKK